MGRRDVTVLDRLALWLGAALAAAPLIAIFAKATN